MKQLCSIAADDGGGVDGVSADRRIGSGWRVSSIILDFLMPTSPRYSAYGYKAPYDGGATKHQDHMRSTVSGVLSLPTHFVSEELCRAGIYLLQLSHRLGIGLVSEFLLANFGQAVQTLFQIEENFSKDRKNIFPYQDKKLKISIQDHKNI